MNKQEYLDKINILHEEYYGQFIGKCFSNDKERPNMELYIPLRYSIDHGGCFKGIYINETEVLYNCGYNADILIEHNIIL